MAPSASASRVAGPVESLTERVTPMLARIVRSRPARWSGAAREAARRSATAYRAEVFADRHELVTTQAADGVGRAQGGP